MASEFWELYQRPEWQRKRLEVIERSGWKCDWCSDAESQLQVHHSFYEKGRKPWEYETSSLHCLCGECHKKFQTIKKHSNKLFGGMSLKGILMAYGAIYAITAQELWKAVYAHDGSFFNPSFPTCDLEFLYGVALILTIDLSDIAKKVGDFLTLDDLSQMQVDQEGIRYQSYHALQKSIDEDYVVYA